jgi:hypothetical protein
LPERNSEPGNDVLPDHYGALLADGVMLTSPEWLFIGRQPGSERLELRMRGWAVKLMEEPRCRYYGRFFRDMSISSTMAAA